MKKEFIYQLIILFVASFLIGFFANKCHADPVDYSDWTCDFYLKTFWNGEWLCGNWVLKDIDIPKVTISDKYFVQEKITRK